MKRRRFLELAAGVLGLSALGALAWRQLARGPDGAAAHSWAEALFDERFAGCAAAAGGSRAALAAALREKGVLSADGRLDPARVRELAREDPLVPCADLYYTETELELYSLAYWIRSGEGR